MRSIPNPRPGECGDWNPMEERERGWQCFARGDGRTSSGKFHFRMRFPLQNLRRGLHLPVCPRLIPQKNPTQRAAEFSSAPAVPSDVASALLWRRSFLGEGDFFASSAGHLVADIKERVPSSAFRRAIPGQSAKSLSKSTAEASLWPPRMWRWLCVRTSLEILRNALPALRPSRRTGRGPGTPEAP